MKEYLFSFESGHYKKFKGQWDGDSVWNHCTKEDGTKVHINKDRVEYVEERETVEKRGFAIEGVEFKPIGGVKLK